MYVKQWKRMKKNENTKVTKVHIDQGRVTYRPIGKLWQTDRPTNQQTNRRTWESYASNKQWYQLSLVIRGRVVRWRWKDVEWKSFDKDVNKKTYVIHIYGALIPTPNIIRSMVYRIVCLLGLSPLKQLFVCHKSAVRGKWQIPSFS